MRATVLGLGEAGTLYSVGLVKLGWTVTGFDPADNADPGWSHPGGQRGGRRRGAERCSA